MATFCLVLSVQTTTALLDAGNILNDITGTNEAPCEQPHALFTSQKYGLTLCALILDFPADIGELISGLVPTECKRVLDASQD